MNKREEEIEKTLDNVTRLDIVRRSKGAEKLCKCKRPAYIIDETNVLVYCNVCNAVIDPYIALCNLADIYEDIEREAERVKEEARQARNYKPRTQLFMNLEKSFIEYGSRLMPVCPHCEEKIELGDLRHWTSRYK